MKFSLPLLVVFLAFSCAISIAAISIADEATNHPSDTESTIEFNRDVRPILAEYCFACHGTDEESRAADLRLDLREEAIDGGAIEPHDVDASELVSRIHSDDEDAVMPPPETKKSLSNQQKQILETWIAEGAAYQAHWSLEPIEKSTPPQANDKAWNESPIDQFVAARLAEAGIQPAAPADPKSLFRRLHLDITGLPPSPSDVIEFEQAFADNADQAVNSAVDRLMATSAWGEHRGRYWLDAARYADTHGMHFDNYREMWPYRDWVIRAFNDNKPFDDFYTEQLAGDLLTEPTDDQLIATGFLRCNMTTNEGGTIDEENLAIYAADRVQTFGWVFLGLTTNCAQCHDHKFDTFSTRDYYSLAAYFRNIDHPAKDGNHKSGKGPTMLVPAPDDAVRIDKLAKQIETQKAIVKKDVQLAHAEFKTWRSELTAESLMSPQSIGIESEAQTPLLSMPLNLASGPTMTGRWAEPARLIPYGAPSHQQVDAEHPAHRSAMNFKKPDSIEVIDIPPQSTTDPLSVSFWFKPESNYEDATVISRVDPAGNNVGWEIELKKRQLHFRVTDRSGELSLSVRSRQNIANAKKWLHVTFTYDGSQSTGGVRMYVSGEAKPVDVVANTLKEAKDVSEINNPIRIANRPGANGWQGALHSIQIDDRAISPWSARRLAKLSAAVDALAHDQANQEGTKQLRNYYSEFVFPASAQSKADLFALEAEKNDIVSRSPITHIAKERGQEAKTNILMRGEYDAKGEEVIANTPEALHPLPDDAPRNRLGLAGWVVDPENPLTPRVTVNRFWQEIFGQGIVTTPDDFGVTGALPSHPELLDFLARDFVQHGWDVKRFYKNIFVSQTFRQAAIATPEKIRLDPTNRLISRGPRFRMDAEMIRDSALTVSDLLSDEMFGPGVRPYQPSDIWNIVGLPSGDTRNYVQDRGEKLYRRTLYSFWKRMAPPPNMETFGAPNRENCVVKRERTNTPLQALVTLNDEQFVEAARALADRTIAEVGNEKDAIMDAIAARLLSRDLQAAERSLIDESFQAYLKHYQGASDDAQKLLSVGQYNQSSSIEPANLAAWTMVCNQLMNLDEVLCK